MASFGELQPTLWAQVVAFSRCGISSVEKWELTRLANREMWRCGDSKEFSVWEQESGERKSRTVDEGAGGIGVEIGCVFLDEGHRSIGEQSAEGRSAEPAVTAVQAPPGTVTTSPHHKGLHDALVRCTLPGPTAIPAVTVAAVAHGIDVVCTGAAGTVGGENGDSPEESVDVDTTIFMTASISKTVLAVLCLQCQELGEMLLDEDINEYLRDVNIVTPTPPGVAHDTLARPMAVRNPAFEKAPITARHLLTHSAGLLDDESALMPGPFRTSGGDCPIPLAVYIQQRLCEGGEFFHTSLWNSRHPPGAAPYHYSNAGFALLGLVLEGATGIPLQELSTARLFAPLLMRRTSYSLSVSLAMPGGAVAMPHDERQRAVGHYGVAEFPAAGLRSTAGDLARYLTALMAPSR